jgi:amino acid transporter
MNDDKKIDFEKREKDLKLMKKIMPLGWLVYLAFVYAMWHFNYIDFAKDPFMWVILLPLVVSVIMWLNFDSFFKPNYRPDNHNIIDISKKEEK